MEWITQNWPQLLEIITAIVTIASLVANLTPTETDNKIVAYIVRAVNLLGFNLKKNL